MNDDFLLPAYQKLYAALNSLERFSKGQDLFDNIACIDSFLAEYRNVTFVLQKSLAHTDYLHVYERLRDKHLKNHQCSWLVNKRNEVLKEKPFALEKQLILNIYLPHAKESFYSKKYTIEDEVNYTSLIESVKNIIYPLLNYNRFLMPPVLKQSLAFGQPTVFIQHLQVTSLSKTLG